MDSLEPNKVSLEENQEKEQLTTPAVEPKESLSQETNSTQSTNLHQLSKADLVNQLREALENADDENPKNIVDNIKQLFYKKHKQELDVQLAGMTEEERQSFVPEPDVYEAELKALIQDYKEKRAKQNAEVEATKGKNLEQRQQIVDQIKSFLDSPESIHEHIAEFRQLQQTWKEIGAVPPASANHLFKNYFLYVENFYDLLKINNELRDYDFKKNLELKTALCEAAENLDKEPDVISAFYSLQRLHEEWTQIGPVARELREELWTRFKAASSVINKKHQAHFDTIKEHEEENLKQKEQICEALESFDLSDLKTFKDWEEKTEEIIKIQQAWKAIGFAPRKMNVKIYERYRNACDKFFVKKSEFYKVIKEELQQNLEKKKVLVAKAEALKNSTDWKEFTRILVELQKEWKTIGAVPRKQSDYIWKQFIAACDYFFEQKNKNFASQKTEEQLNLDKKKTLVENIENFKRTDDLSESVATLKLLIAEWNNIGHVPFKEKDKIYKRYKEACDKQFEALNVDAHNRHIDTFKVSLDSMAGKDKNHLFREREKLLKQFDHLKNEILTCENNICFFTSKSNAKKPNPMIEQMQRNIDKLKEDRDLLLKKIQMIEAQLA